MIARILAWFTPTTCSAEKIIARQPEAEQRILRAINHELAAR